MPVLVQSLTGANNFDGTANNGLFDFSDFDSMKRGKRIRIANMSYHALADPGSQIDFLAESPAGGTRIILIGRATTDLVGPAGDGDFRVCNFIVPRNSAGAFYTVQAISTGKTGDGSVIVDFEIVDFVDSISPWV